MGAPARIYADPARERVGTSATVITGVRTVIAVALAVWAAYHEDLTLLVVSLVVYWVGDSLDGIVARIRDCETRTGAALDILSDPTPAELRISPDVERVLGRAPRAFGEWAERNVAAFR